MAALDDYTKKLISQLDGMEDPDCIAAARSREQIGDVFKSRGDHNEALKCYNEALRIREKHSESDTLKVAKIKHCIGELLCLEALKGSPGFGRDDEDSSDTGAYTSKLGTTFEEIVADETERQEKLRSAAEHLEYALRTRRKKRSHLDAADTSYRLGLTFLHVHGKDSEAQEALRFAVATRKGVLGNNNSLVAEASGGLGCAHLRIGNQRAAIDAYKDALSVIKSLHGDESLEVSGALVALANAYATTGDPATALEYFSMAVAVCEKVHDQNRKSTKMPRLPSDFPKSLQHLPAMDSTSSALRRVCMGSGDPRMLRQTGRNIFLQEKGCGSDIGSNADEVAKDIFQTRKLTHLAWSAMVAYEGRDEQRVAKRQRESQPNDYISTLGASSGEQADAGWMFENAVGESTQTKNEIPGKVLQVLHSFPHVSLGSGQFSHIASRATAELARGSVHAKKSDHMAMLEYIGKASGIYKARGRHSHDDNWVSDCLIRLGCDSAGDEPGQQDTGWLGTMAEQVDVHGNTPLHSALWRKTPYVVVLSLVKAFPKAATLANHQGETPLHYIRRGINMESFFAVFKGNSKAIRMKDRLGRTPLHNCMRFGAPFRAIALILEEYPEAARMPDSVGRLPLHLAGDDDFSIPDAVLAVLEAYPQAARRVDQYGLTPLHLVTARSKAARKLICRVTEAHPGALRTCSTERFSYPADDRGSSIEINKGATPLSLAEREGRPTENKELLLALQSVVSKDISVEEAAKMFNWFEDLGLPSGMRLVVESYPSMLSNLVVHSELVALLLSRTSRYGKVGEVYETMRTYGISAGLVGSKHALPCSDNSLQVEDITQRL